MHRFLSNQGSPPLLRISSGVEAEHLVLAIWVIDWGPLSKPQIQILISHNTNRIAVAFLLRQAQRAQIHLIMQNSTRMHEPVIENKSQLLSVLFRLTISNICARMSYSKQKQTKHLQTKQKSDSQVKNRRTSFDVAFTLLKMCDLRQVLKKSTSIGQEIVLSTQSNLSSVRIFFLKS